MKAFNDLLVHLGTQLDADAITLQDAALAMATYIQGAMACSRMTVWMVDDAQAEGRALWRMATFDGETQRAEMEPIWLRGAEVEGLFDALSEKGIYASTDAQADVRFAGMRESHLVPNDVRSVLAATIGANGHVWAVYCCTQRGEARLWTPKEVMQFKRYADAISLRRVRRRRREAEAARLAERLLQAQKLPKDVSG